MRHVAAACFALVAAALLLGVSRDAQAIPAFSRKHNVGCNACHIAYPLLNTAGRRFREAGYRFANMVGKVEEAMQANKTITTGLTLDPSFPISARARGWAFQATNEHHARIRPVDEASLLAAGLWARQGSFFLEATADDEGEWIPDVGVQVGYHPSRFASVLAGTMGPFHPDPYNTFRDPLTLSERSSVVRIAEEDVGRPTLEAWGRLRKLYYAGALTVAEDNFTGIKPRIGFGRLAVDFSPRNMVGAFAFGGERTATEITPERSVLRTGLDWNLAWRQLYLIGLVALLREQTDAGHDYDVTGFQELFYAIPLRVERLLIPLVRLEVNTFDDRDQTQVGLIAGTYFQFVQNARVGIEGGSDLKPQESSKRMWVVGVNLDVAL